ncbi:MAG: cation diffusion facilitator family transporter [Myxococcota bacterium]
MPIDRHAHPETGAREHPNGDVQRVLWITLALNLLVAGAKLYFGYAADIVSLQADGFHSIFDGASNIIGLVALGLATKPPDPEHPYGHRKIEVAASFSIGLMVLLGMLEVGRGLWDAAVTGTTPQITFVSYVVVVGAILTSLGVSFYERRAARKYDSMILEADSAHTLTDSLAGMAVLVGIFLVERGVPSADLMAALAVMFFIGVTAYRVLRDGMDVLVDTSLLEPQAVREIVESIEEVESCHYVRSRGMPGHVHVDLHLTLDPEMKLERAGEILLDVKALLKEEFGDVADVIVQIEPHKKIHVEDVPETLV